MRNIQSVSKEAVTQVAEKSSLYRLENMFGFTRQNQDILFGGL